MILILDNYDSFTYNLFQAFGALEEDVRVVLNDRVTPQEIVALVPSHLIISPGPGRPEDAGISVDVVTAVSGQMPVLGICLGHQSICQAFGGEIVPAKQLVHGKSSMIHVANGDPLFHDLPPLLEAGRYHSLAVRRESLPDELMVIAETDDGEVMGVKHRDCTVYGLQFHPESILTPSGMRIIKNFVAMGGKDND